MSQGPDSTKQRAALKHGLALLISDPLQDVSGEALPDYRHLPWERLWADLTQAAGEELALHLAPATFRDAAAMARRARHVALLCPGSGRGPLFEEEDEPRARPLHEGSDLPALLSDGPESVLLLYDGSLGAARALCQAGVPLSVGVVEGEALPHLAAARLLKLLCGLLLSGWPTEEALSRALRRCGAGDLLRLVRGDGAWSQGAAESGPAPPQGEPAPAPPQEKSVGAWSQGSAESSPALPQVEPAPAPPPVQPFWGRAAEAADLLHRLCQPGLMCLTGPSGSGKSELCRLLYHRIHLTGSQRGADDRDGALQSASYLDLAELPAPLPLHDDEGLGRRLTERPRPHLWIVDHIEAHLMAPAQRARLIELVERLLTGQARVLLCGQLLPEGLPLAGLGQITLRSRLAEDDGPARAPLSKGQRERVLALSADLSPHTLSLWRALSDLPVGLPVTAVVDDQVEVLALTQMSLIERAEIAGVEALRCPLRRDGLGDSGGDEAAATLRQGLRRAQGAALCALSTELESALGGAAAEQALSTFSAWLPALLPLCSAPTDLGEARRICCALLALSDYAGEPALLARLCQLGDELLAQPGPEELPLRLRVAEMRLRPALKAPPAQHRQLRSEARQAAMLALVDRQQPLYGRALLLLGDLASEPPGDGRDGRDGHPGGRDGRQGRDERDDERARDRYLQARQHYAQTGDRRGECEAVVRMIRLGAPLPEALLLSQQAGQLHFEAQVRRALGRLLEDQGGEGAAVQYRLALEKARAAGHRAEVALSLLALGRLLAESADEEDRLEASCRLGEALPLLRMVGLGE